MTRAFLIYSDVNVRFAFDERVTLVDIKDKYVIRILDLVLGVLDLCSLMNLLR